jgi:ubiquinone/menaquinone biosynthesis C-methylase UbiE
MKISDNIASEFNEFSKDYTNDMVKCVPYYNALISSFTENLPPDFQPLTILDLGCGNGNVTAQLLPSFPKSEYTLVDASDEMLNLCKSRFKDFKINCVTSYFQAFEFGENQYDFIVAGFSLHHCNSKEKKELFKKIYTALKPNGVFSCSDLMIDKNLMIDKKSTEHTIFLEQWKSFVLNNYTSQEKWEWLMEHYSEFDKPDSFNNQKKWLKKAGFSTFNTIINKTYWLHFQVIKS